MDIHTTVNHLGKGQCHGGTHEYELTKTWRSSERSSSKDIKKYKIKVNKKATDVSTTDGSIKKTGYSITISGKDTEKNKEATFTDSDIVNKDNLAKNIKVSYIPNGSDKGEKDRTSEGASVKTNKNLGEGKNKEIGLSKDNKTYFFDVHFPSNASKCRIEIDIEVKNAEIKEEWYTEHYLYHCVSVGPSHGGGCRNGASNTQDMGREEPGHKKEVLSKHLRGTIKFDVEYGNIQIIKVDKNSNKLVKEDNTGTTVFRIYQLGEDDKKLYIADTTKGAVSEFTKDPEEAKAFKINSDGIIKIDYLRIDYEYYLEEVSPKQGYLALEEDIKLNLNDTDVSHRTQLKRAMKYIFTTSTIRNRMYNLCLNGDELDKEKFIKYVYNTCIGKNKTSSVNSDILKYLKKECELSGKPSKSEIKEIIDCVFNDEYKKDTKIVKDDAIEKIFKDDDTKNAYVNRIKSNFGDQSAREGDLRAVKAYLEEYKDASGNKTGYIPFVVENQKTNGWLKILKNDADRGTPLTATFWISGTTDLGEPVSMIVTTNGGVWKQEMKAGTYRIEEVTAPQEYVLEYQLDTIRENVVVTTDHTEQIPCEVKFVNKKYENLRITKVDKDTDQVMPNVGFKVQHPMGQYMQVWKRDEYIAIAEGDVNFNPVYYTKPETIKPNDENTWFHVGYTTDINSATMFLTNNAGEITISNLDAVNPIYYVTEESISGNLTKYYDISGNGVMNLDVKSTSESSYTRQSGLLQMVQDFKDNRFLKQNVYERKFTEEEKRNHVKTLVNALCGYPFNNADVIFTSQLTGKQAEFISDIMSARYISDRYNGDINELLNNPEECRNIIRGSGLYTSKEIYEFEKEYNGYWQPDEGKYHEGNRNVYRDILKDLVDTYQKEANQKEKIERDTTILNFLVEEYDSTDNDEEFIKYLLSDEARNNISYQYNNMIKKQYEEAINKIVTEVKRGLDYKDDEKIKEAYDKIATSLKRQYPNEIECNITTDYETKEKEMNIIVKETNYHCQFKFIISLKENIEEKATKNVKNKIENAIEGLTNNYKQNIANINNSDDTAEKKSRDKKDVYANMIENIDHAINNKLNSELMSNYKIKDYSINGNVLIKGSSVDIERVKDWLNRYEYIPSTPDIPGGRKDIYSFNDIGKCMLNINVEIEYKETVNSDSDRNNGSMEIGSSQKEIVRTKEIVIEYEINRNGNYIELYSNSQMVYNPFIYDILSPKLEDKEHSITRLFEVYLERSAKQSEIKYYKLLMEGKPSLRIENEQKWIDMSGYVWEDNERNKNGTTSASDGKYDSASENKVANILVSLKDSNGAIVLDKYGNPCSKVTDSRGNYKFENIPLVRNEKGQITNLASYHMEFQYDGFTYTSVILADLYGSNTSKAAEVPENRTSLNNRFAQVTQGEAIGVDGNRLVLNYDKSERKYANYINEAWKYEDDGSLVITAHKQNGHSEYDMLATTTNAGYVIQQGQGDRQYEITDINLGIKAREMPNALIYNHDVDNVKVTINGHTNVYKYDQNMVPANLSNLDYGQLVANVSSYKRWIAPSYIKSIQDLSTSDNELKIYVTYKITLKNASNTLRMNINGLIDYYDSKYKDDISVGTAIQTDQNQDNYYGIINNRRQEAGKIVNQLTATSSEGEAYGYKAANIQGVGGPVAELDAGQEANIYVQYEVKRGAIESVLDDDTTMNSVAEIYSFTTYYGQSTEVDTASGRQGQVYAAVDADSAPWNAQIGSNLEELKEQYENDTDISPGITLTVGNERAIEGNVFEDLPKADNGFDKDQVNTDKERIGDGIFVPEEKSIKEILVELIPINTNGENTPNKEGIAYIYPKIDEGNTIDKYNNKYVSDNSDETDGKKAKYIASTVTDKDGKYEFIGIVPGHYQVKFSYGENVEYKEATIGGQIVDKENPNNNQKITVEKYKSTIRTAKEEDINYDNEYWYAYDNEGDPNVPRYSDALDDYSKRNLINKTLETIDYGKKTAYEKGKIGSTMDSNTNTMDVAIQNREKAVIVYITEEEGEPTGTIKNIDFGIIERPRQELKVEKIIKNLKITLANGQVLFDGNPKETTSQYVTYPKDSELVKIEIDNEILQGSTLEVKYGIRVTNLAERDYSGEEYYHYGRPSDPLLVKQTISKLLDYMDDKLSTTYDKYDSEAEGEKIQKLSKEDIGTFYKGDTDNKIYEGQNQKIDYKTYDSIKNNSNIIIIENDNRLKDLAPNSSTEIEVTATKILSTSNDNLFINNTEIIEEKNSVGRFTYSSTPGNYFSANTEPDGEREDVTVIPPTGEKNITQYIVIGTICLLVLTGGIILIKKKVLDS